MMSLTINKLSLGADLQCDPTRERLEQDISLALLRKKVCSSHISHMHTEERRSISYQTGHKLATSVSVFITQVMKTQLSLLLFVSLQSFPVMSCINSYSKKTSF